MITYLFVGLGALCVIAFLFFRDKKSSLLAITLKTLSSIFFIVTALVAATNNESMDINKTIFTILVVSGLLFGLVGDFTLDFKQYFKSLNYETHMKDSDFITYVGMGAFAVGHILYISGACVIYPNESINLIYSSLGALIAAFLIIFIFGEKLSHLHFNKFLIPSLVYCFLLTNFGIFSLIIMIHNMSTANIIRFVGSMMFLISDLILSFTYFSEPQKFLEKSPLKNPESRLYIISNHGTYYIAQFLLAIMLMFI